MKDKVSSDVANKALQPLVDYAKANRGTITEVVRLLNKRTRKKWRRENVGKWLHENTAKRTQPLLGVGLLLVEIGKALATRSQVVSDAANDQAER